MAEETTGGVNYGLLGPHSGTQFKPTSMKDVEQYLRDTRELKRKKAEERALQALQSVGPDAMRKSLMSDGFGEMAEPLERQIAQTRQAEILSTIENARKIKMYEEGGFIPKGTADKLFNTQQKEVIVPADEFAPTPSQGSAITSKVGETEAVIGPGSSTAPISPKYVKEAPPAASRLASDLALVPYEDPNAPASVKQRAYNWKFSDKTVPGAEYEPKVIQTAFNLSAVPSSEEITTKIYERAEALVPKVNKFAGSPDEVLNKEAERSAKVDKLAIELGDELRKQADSMRSTSLSDKSARAGLTGQELGITKSKKEIQKMEEERARRTPWSPSNPNGNIYLLSGAEPEKIDPARLPEFEERAKQGSRLKADLEAVKKGKYTSYNDLKGLAETYLKATGGSISEESKLGQIEAWGFVPTAEQAAQIQRNLKGQERNVFGDFWNRLKVTTGAYGKPADSTKIKDALDPVFNGYQTDNINIDFGDLLSKRSAKSAVAEMKDKSKKTDTPATKSDKGPKVGEMRDGKVWTGKAWR